MGAFLYISVNLSRNRFDIRSVVPTENDPLQIVTSEGVFNLNYYEIHGFVTMNFLSFNYLIV